MAPHIALILCILFIIFLYKMDSKRDSSVSNALWIPLIWMMAIGSRSITSWLNPGAIVTESIYMGGSPIDRTMYILLIIISIFILMKRSVQMSKILTKNVSIILLMLYSGISILWSDFILISFKRWIMGIGCFLMVLIVLTEVNPIEAIKKIFRRYTYAFIPLSIVLIKYYPFIGRSYNPWTGMPEYVGVTTSKNMLGQLCFVCGLSFSWQFLLMWRNRDISFNKKELFLNGLFVLMISWLLMIADSATSSLSLILGICILAGLSAMKRNMRYLGVYIFIAIVLFTTVQISFDVIQFIIPSLGRDSTLSGRTELWDEILKMAANPLIGTGYESFWLGERMSKLWDAHWWGPIQSHNGYIEIFLNLGYIGLFLLMLIIVSAYKNIKKGLVSNFDYGIFRMSVLVTVLLHNITEVSFKGTSNMWFAFLLIAFDLPQFYSPQNNFNEIRTNFTGQKELVAFNR